MTTIFDTATPKQIERFAQFKKELLDWKNQHTRDYAAFVKHMNSNDPEAMIGLGHLLAILCPQISFAMVDCWNDDTLSSRDWLQRISEEVSMSSLMDMPNDPSKSIPEGEVMTSEDAMKEAKDFIAQNGSIKDFAQGLMKDMLGDTPVPDELNDMLSGIFESLQSNVDRLMSDETVENTTINDTLNNLQGIFNDCMQMNGLGVPLQDIVKWVGDVKLHKPDDLIPLFLTWLIHGRAFEKIVITLDRQSNLLSWPTNKIILDAAIDAIDSSIENGYRTPQQWLEFFDIFPDLNNYILKKCKEQVIIADASPTISENKIKGKSGREKGLDGTLSQYLTCRNPALVLKKRENFIKTHPTANDIALTGIVLRKLNLIPDLTEDRETSSAIYKEFSTRIPDMRAESSIRRSMGVLNQSIVKTEKDGSKREIFEYDIEPYASRIQILMTEIKKVLRP